MKLRLPPHIAWPLFIVGLLSMSVTAAIVTAIAANSDGGPQVVESYHEQAAGVDAQAQLRAESAALGWDAQIDIEPLRDAQGLHRITIDVADADGTPLAGLSGAVTLRRPHLAAAVTTVPVTADAEVAGRYVLRAPMTEAGLWDLDLELSGEGSTFVATARHELR